MREATSQFPNIERWLGRYLKGASALPEDEYVVLRHELREGPEYKDHLLLLDAHLGVAAEKCEGFPQLLNERRGFGSDVDNANRMLLDKLAEIRAVVGLVQCGFSNIHYSRSPDLTANKAGEVYAVEVTRIAAPGGIREPPQDITVRVLSQEDPNDPLIRQLISKALSKRDQILKTPYATANHLIWVSTGRDYFTAGRYEPEEAGLRGRMSRSVKAIVEAAATNPLLTSGYPERPYLAASPGRDASPFILRVA